MERLITLKDISKVKDVQFYREDKTRKKTLHPKEIFLEYASLDELIKHNHNPVAQRKAYAPIEAKETDESTRKQLAKEARAKLAQPAYSARINYINGNSEDLEVKLRTNFEDDLVKRPTVIQLGKESFPLLIVREARTYELTEIDVIFKQIRKQARKRYQEN